MSLQYMIQLCRSPTTARLCPLVSFVRNSQLILQVLSNPLCQFGWQLTQDRISTLYKYLNHDALEGKEVHLIGIRGAQVRCRILSKLDSDGLEKIDVEARTTT